MTKYNYIISLIIFISSFAFGQNEIEPNNSFNAANTLTLNALSASIQGTINPAGDVDYYRVEVPRAGVFVADVFNIPSNIDMDITLYDTGQNEITSNHAESGMPLNITKLVCDAGIYYFRLRDFDTGLGDSNNDSSPEPYSFTVTFDISDIYECNNQFATATSIQIGTEINATIRSADDKDYYKIEIPRAGVIVADVFNIPSNIDMDIVLYDAGQNEITSNHSEDGMPVNLTKLVCDAGIYYFRLRDFDTGLGDSNNDSSPEPYSFTVTFDTSDIYECNNQITTATPIQIGTEINATIRSADDKDYYKIEIPRAGVFVADVFNIPSNIDMDIVLYDAGQNEITSNHAESGMPVNLTKLVCDAGIYYFRLRDIDTGFGDSNNDSSPEPYSFTVTFDTSDIYECNNQITTATPIQIGTEINATIRSADDKDYYKIEIPRAGVFVADVFNIPSNIDMDIVLYDAGQNEITSNHAESGMPVNLTKLVCDAGIYYFRLRDIDTGFGDSNNDSSPEPYSFTVTFDTSDIYECNNQFTTATSINTCDTIFAAINSRGDQDYYIFNGTNSQEILIELSNIPSDITPRIRIFDDSQNQITVQTGNAGMTLTYDFAPPSTGSFYLRVEEAGDNESNPQLYQLILKDNSCETTISNSIIRNDILKVYPNPTSQVVFIGIEEESSNMDIQLKIYNSIGQELVLYKNITDKKQIFIDDLPNGILIFKFQNRDEILVYKILKE